MSKIMPTISTTHATHARQLTHTTHISDSDSDTQKPSHIDIPHRKKKINKALREQIWIQRIGNHFEAKCSISWCQNTMNVFNFQAGHDIPESKGGSTTLANLHPICARCNLSMSNNYTISEWNGLHVSLRPSGKTSFRKWYCCF